MRAVAPRQEQQFQGTAVPLAPARKNLIVKKCIPYTKPYIKIITNLLRDEESYIASAKPTSAGAYHSSCCGM